MMIRVDPETQVNVEVDDASSVEIAGITKTWTYDADMHELLITVLSELKKITLHLSIVTDSLIQDVDVEGQGE